MPSKLRMYIGLWIAVAPTIGLLYAVGYLQDYLHFPLWASILAMIVTIHIAFGWMYFIVGWLDKD